MTNADISRVDLLIQYALLVAGESDEWMERQLGPIHLIKYVYLGDLAYARRHEGKTFTGVNWQFYKFGPWSQEVNARIQPALSYIGAVATTLPSDFEGKDDWTRWSVRDDHLLEEKERALPAAITTHLRPDIRKFGKDTPNLLDYVYRSSPMLNAAPHENLDFSVVARSPGERRHESPALRVDSLSESKKKKLRERLQALRKESEQRVRREQSFINPVKNPRFDKVYDEGVAWLDEIAGEPLKPGEKAVEFTDDVWKSQARKGGDVS